MKILLPSFAALALASACSVVEPSKLEAFGKIRTGQTTPEDAIELLGSPEARVTRALFGVQVEVWTYADRDNNYTLTIGGSNLLGAEPRVIASSMDPRLER